MRVEGVPVYRCLYADWNDLIRGKIGDSGVRRVAGIVFLWVGQKRDWQCRLCISNHDFFFFFARMCTLSQLSTSSNNLNLLNWKNFLKCLKHIFFVLLSCLEFIVPRDCVP